MSQVADSPAVSQNSAPLTSPSPQALEQSALLKPRSHWQWTSAALMLPEPMQVPLSLHGVSAPPGHGRQFAPPYPGRHALHAPPLETKPVLQVQAPVPLVVPEPSQVPWPLQTSLGAPGHGRHDGP